eukprot:scaffold63423_cov68-Phaeocystis_antarctica.AAC.1
MSFGRWWRDSANVEAPHLDREPDAQARARHGRLLRRTWRARRQLGWLGHVARMDYSRLPRRMLSCWVSHKRPPSAPRMTYGRSILKALDTFDLDHKKWPELAADRLARLAGDAAQRAVAARLPRAAPDPRRPAHREHTAPASFAGGHHRRHPELRARKLAATTRLGVKKKTYQN